MVLSAPRTAGWDPWLLISQIVSLQSFHYLTLCLLIPLFLTFFAEPVSLAYEGGAMNIGMIMDWREMSSQPTVHGLHGQDHRGWDAFTGVYSGGKKVAIGAPVPEESLRTWDGRIDTVRGWCIAISWLLASAVEYVTLNPTTPCVYYLYTFVRRPRLILDFGLTLVLNHLILTTYYSAALPLSPFFWFVIILGAALTIVSAEQLCVRREMREGLGLAPWTTESADGNAYAGDAEAMELGQLRRD